MVHEDLNQSPLAANYCEVRAMKYQTIGMNERKRIALVAHDNTKPDLLEWAQFNRDLLVEHELYATGTTGTVLEESLGMSIIKLQSGPLGGDQQIGAKDCRRRN